MLKRILNFFISFFSAKNKDTILKKSYIKYDINSFDIEIFQQINKYRQSRGLSFLEQGVNECFDIVGNHISWLAENITSKTDFDKKGHFYFNDRAEQIKLRTNCKNVSEVLAYNYKQSKSVINAWDKSEKHNEVMNGKFTHVVVASKDKYILAIFYNVEK